MRAENSGQLETAARNEYYRAVIRNYTMMSDAFARNVLRDAACAEQVLRVILEKPDLQVVEVHVQEDYKNLQGRSSILDCVARDSQGSLYDIEVEHEGQGFPPKRARYYSGLLDMNTLRQREEYTLLRQACVICITDQDTLGEGLPIYHIRRVIEETGRLFEDETLIIYVNAALQENTALGRLVHDFHCADAAQILNPVLRAKVSALKNTPEEVEDMCTELRKIEEYGEMKRARESALRMYRSGLAASDIARYLDVSIQQVQEWIDESVIPA